MSEIGNLTLHREKSTVHRFAELGEGEIEEPMLEIRSNRVTVPLKLGGNTYNCVIRGQNIPVALRMTGLVVDQFRRDPKMVHEAADLDWENRWIRRLSPYETEYNPSTWISLHIEGEPIYSTGAETMEVIHGIESLAAGGEVNDAIIMEASSNVIGALEDLVVDMTVRQPTFLRLFLHTTALQYWKGRVGKCILCGFRLSPKS